MKSKEVTAYYKMLRGLLVLKSPSKGAIPVDLITFLDGFNKYWKKYYAREFRE
jgi:hypothetical protein